MKPRPNELQTISVSISPIDLLSPLVEGTAEYRLSLYTGVSGILGVGFISSGGENFAVQKLCAQFCVYALGEFDDGLQIGTEIL